MNKTVYAWICTLLVVTTTNVSASELANSIPSGASQQFANTYYDIYVTQGRTPCPTTVRNNARGQANSLEGLMAGLAATMETAGELDGFADYFWNVLGAGEKCGDALGKVPSPVTKAVGDGLSKGSALTRAATKPGGCLSLSTTQKQQYELYLAAQAAKKTWEAVAAACPQPAQ